MSKIYVVTEGYYSSYHIVDIFSTKEKAQEVVDHFEGCMIEEYELDPEKYYILKKGYKFYYLEMFEDGTVMYGEKRIYKTVDYTDEAKSSLRIINNALGDYEEYTLNMPQIEKYKVSKSNDFCRIIDSHPNKDGELYMKITVQASDEQHAIKIANEKRIQMKANNLFKSIQT